MITAALWSGSGNAELVRMDECAEVQVFLPDTQGLGMDSIILMSWPLPPDCSRCLIEILHALFNLPYANVGSHIF